MTGQGKLYSGADKLLYSGEWLHDVFHGYGTYYYPNGKISYQGRWKNSKADGPGMFQDTTGRIWSGYFKNGEYIGENNLSSDEVTVVLPTESLPLRKSSDSTPRDKLVVYEEDIPSPKSADSSEKICFRPCNIRQKNIGMVNPIHNIIIISRGLYWQALLSPPVQPRSDPSSPASLTSSYRTEVSSTGPSHW